MKPKRHLSDHRERSLVAYSAAAGALLAANHAGADIVHETLDVTLSPYTQFSLSFELPGGNYSADFSVSSLNMYGWHSWNITNTARVTGQAERRLDANNRPMVLSFGQQIRTNGAAFGNGTVLGSEFSKGNRFRYTMQIPVGTIYGGSRLSTRTHTNTHSSQGSDGNFTGLENVYLGLRVTDQEVDYYGWVELSLSSDLSTLTLHSWAYENKGADIAAGVIPEPAHLGLLAAGAAGLLAWRRKRRQN